MLTLLREILTELKRINYNIEKLMEKKNNEQ